MRKLTKERLDEISFDDVLDQLSKLTGSYIYRYNTYEDIMSLAFAHHLTMHYVDNGYEHKWFATKPYTPEHYHDADPLRAIACCLILVLQEKS